MPPYPRRAADIILHFRLESPVGFKSVVLRLLRRANVVVVRADALERERQAANVSLKLLRALDEAEWAETNRAAELAPAPADPKVRPLERITRDADFAGKPAIDKEWIGKLLQSKHFAAVADAYRDYPERSFVSVTERAFLFCLVRAMKPHVVAEIGTAFCGTSEIIARALWENGTGVLHTTDPFGGKRCPPIMQQWPQPLQDVVRFYVKSSMDFILALANVNTTLDIAFIDGNHDFEFAYFDIMMAARLLRPGGIMIIDNSEQSGPYYAAVQFVHNNPNWIELGDAIANFQRSEPFPAERSSVPHGGFLALRAPDNYAIGEVPRSTGQIVLSASRVDGLTATLEPGDFRGTLHYQMIFRAFRNGNREIEEYKDTGRMRLDTATTGRVLAHRLDAPLVSHLEERHGDCIHTLEIELAWEGADAPTLRLSSAPAPLAPDAARPAAVAGGKQ